MPRKPKKVAKKPAEYDKHHSGFIYPPDPFLLLRRRIPKATVAIFDESGSPVDIQDEFGLEPEKKKLLPSYYYEQEEEEDPIARKFHVLGKGGKIKRPEKVVKKVEEPKVVKPRSVRFAAAENNFEILPSNPQSN